MEFKKVLKKLTLSEEETKVDSKPKIQCQTSSQQDQTSKQI